MTSRFRLLAKAFRPKGVNGDMTFLWPEEETLLSEFRDTRFELWFDGLNDLD